MLKEEARKSMESTGNFLDLENGLCVYMGVHKRTCIMCVHGCTYVHLYRMHMGSQHSSEECILAFTVRPGIELRLIGLHANPLAAEPSHSNLQFEVP